jgi:hypothetical protein
MTQPISTHEIPAVLPQPRRVKPAIVAGGAVLGAVILLGALVLWFYYGTTVFFEMIASGVAACF